MQHIILTIFFILAIPQVCFAADLPSTSRDTTIEVANAELVETTDIPTEIYNQLQDPTIDHFCENIGLEKYNLPHTPEQVTTLKEDAQTAPPRSMVLPLRSSNLQQLLC